MYDHTFYSKIVDKYKDLAFTIALKITGNMQDAEEIVQDAFVKAFQGMDKFKGESRFSTWFYRIVYNTAISKSRLKHNNIQKIEWEHNAKTDFSELNNAIENLDREDRQNLIREAMAKLDQLDYTILTLYYLEGKDFKDIATITGQKRGYLKVLMQRARHKLYNTLDHTVKKELKELIR